MKKICLLSLALFCSIYAQDRHEASLHIGGGWSSLMYDPVVGDHSSWLDAQFGFGYAFFFGKSVGLATGLELAFYNAEFKLKSYEMKYKARDTYEKVDFDFSSELNKYTEEQSSAMLQIPLMLQLQTGGKNLKHFVLAGAKVAIPITGLSKGKGNIANSGYYEEEGYTYYQNEDGENLWSFRGFGEFKDKKIENKYNFKTSFLASMEIGMKFRLQDGLALYTSAYLDYGLNNIVKSRKADKMPHMVQYDSLKPADFAMNSMLNAKYQKDGGSEQLFASSIKPMAIGVKLKLALGAGVNHFEKQDSQSAETKRLEAEKRELEAELERSRALENETRAQEAERIAAAERLMREARIAYDNAMREQQAMQLNAAEVARLTAERAQLENEVARLTAAGANASGSEIPALPPQMPAEAIAQETRQSGEYAIQVAVMLEEARALQMVNMLKQSGFNAYYKQVSNPGKLTGIYYRVRIGYFDSSASAGNFARTRLAQSYRDWWIDRVANDSRGY